VIAICLLCDRPLLDICEAGVSLECAGSIKLSVMSSRRSACSRSGLVHAALLLFYSHPSDVIMQLPPSSVLSAATLQATSQAHGRHGMASMLPTMRLDS
jgi:hypothetical protein